ncbi:alkaline phosphatase family protein [Paenarthrobacter sp. PH39-S1]|uniref:alkaline phosphatase family protein n=1 Tax=Paenarthrobacter sp. PH39-S1 TaxID=3046204 RepID=UPI0024BA7664|nr:alkaline phosphatase family protein [Paenarthrobacter sp. PH39-S1]MDJ0357459.1 alkaline phosphatase family protein [Paenarthrobacter sp. PH39-S1]
MAGTSVLFGVGLIFWPWQPRVPNDTFVPLPWLFAVDAFLGGLCLAAAALSSRTLPLTVGKTPVDRSRQNVSSRVARADRAHVAVWMSRSAFLLTVTAAASWMIFNRIAPSGTGARGAGASVLANEAAIRRRVKHVVVLVQENHTTDNYFGGLAPYGANVATNWPVQPNPPATDQPHDRKAYARWLDGGTGTHTQFDTLSVIPYYAYLAVTGAFLENHCSGFGTDSTPNHLLLMGGQSPTLRNPGSTPVPDWDMPSIPGLAQEAGVSWRCYTAGNHYPARYYSQLKNSPNLLASSAFRTDAESGSLPALSYVWHNRAGNEHPTDSVTAGMDTVWQAVDAVVRAGDWDDTVFLLTWDDWGGWDDHVVTPNIEHTPDGVQLAYGPRVPLIMFGGAVRPGIDSRWSSHVGIGKSVLQLLGLPPLGVDRVDGDAGLADLIDPALHRPAPPPYGSPIIMPPPPSPRPRPAPTPAAPPAASNPVSPVILRNGSTLPPPHDAPLQAQRTTEPPGPTAADSSSNAPLQRERTSRTTSIGAPARGSVLPTPSASKPFRR